MNPLRFPLLWVPVLSLLFGGCTDPPVRQKSASALPDPSSSPGASAAVVPQSEEDENPTLPDDSLSDVTAEAEKTYVPDTLSGSGSRKMELLSNEKNTASENVELQLDTRNGGILTGKSGATVIIPADAFIDSEGKTVEGKVRVVWTEALTRRDFVEHRLHTRSGNELLVSAGMYRLEAYKLQSDGTEHPLSFRPLTVGIPLNKEVANSDNSFFVARTDPATGLPTWSEIPDGQLGYRRRSYDYQYPKLYGNYEQCARLKPKMLFADEEAAIRAYINLDDKKVLQYLENQHLQLAEEFKLSKAFFGSDGMTGKNPYLSPGLLAELSKTFKTENWKPVQIEWDWLREIFTRKQVQVYHSDELIKILKALNNRRTHFTSVGYYFGSVRVGELPALRNFVRDSVAVLNRREELTEYLAQNPLPFIKWKTKYLTTRQGLLRLGISPETYKYLYPQEYRTQKSGTEGKTVTLYDFTPAVAALVPAVSEWEKIGAFESFKENVKFLPALRQLASVEQLLKKARNSEYSVAHFRSYISSNLVYQWMRTFAIGGRYYVRRAEFSGLPSAKGTDSLSIYLRKALRGSVFQNRRMNRLYIDATEMIRFAEKKKAEIDRQAARTQPEDNPMIYYSLNGPGWYNIDRYWKKPKNKYRMVLNSEERFNVISILAQNERLSVFPDRIDYDSVKKQTRLEFTFPAEMNFHFIARSPKETTIFHTYKGKPEWPLPVPLPAAGSAQMSKENFRARLAKLG